MKFSMFFKFFNCEKIYGQTVRNLVLSYYSLPTFLVRSNAEFI